ncbi:MAG: arylsulfatase [Myxococcales bacterium]|nr:arylsulfatase [Myxococcales bacterium]
MEKAILWDLPDDGGLVRRARDRRRHRQSLEVMGSLLLISSMASNVEADSPNIVLILADDLGFTDTAPYGGEVPTPSISALAEQGITFTNHHMAASCAPTRGMLLTGVDSHLNGVPNIPEAIPPEQAEQSSNYRGTLGENVVTIATLLKDAGYHTYMSGKWHLGKTPEMLPSRRGFERTIAMADTGADNWEKKPYLPMYKKANWFGDGKEIDLPDDFYSSKFLVDKMIEFIESNRLDGKPFFSYVPFQAVHMPVQAPQAYIDKYMGKYDGGWAALRERRLESAKTLGVVPADTELAPVPSTEDWDSFTDEEKRYKSKEMAVYAGMIDAMDHHIGRLIQYLEDTGQYDNTVFIFTSDNGPEGTEVLSGARALYLRLWFATHGYSMDYETLGTRGSFVDIGPSFGNAAASPLAYYKFFAHEGGMRVPMIIAGSMVAQMGILSNAFTYVTDLAPTILEIAGVDPPVGSYEGRRVEQMSGKSLVPLLKGQTDRAHEPDETIGYELAGNAALFRGDYKIVTDRGPVGDGEWHLFNFVTDPGEATDLREQMPELFAEMMEGYRSYARDYEVLPVPDGYDQRKEVFRYVLRNNPDPLLLSVVAGLALLILFLAWRGARAVRKRRRA